MVDNTSVLARPVALGIGAVGLLITVVIFVQSVIGIPFPDYYRYILVFAYLSNLAILPVLLFLATRHTTFIFPAVVWAHISMGIMLLYFSQTYSPFTTAWAILILVTAIYYSWYGFMISSIALSVVATAYIILFPEQLIGGVLNYSLLSALVVALTIFLSYLCVKIIERSNKKNQELARSQKSEFMQVNRLNTLINSISDVVLTLNRYGRITSQNAAAQAFFDTNQSLIGRDLERLMELHDKSGNSVSVHDMIHSVKSTTLRDDVSIGKGGDMRHLSVQMSRIHGSFGDNEEYGVVVIIRDITKQKTLEEEKDEFISVTSHELRTPVAIAEGSLSNLLVMHEKNADAAVLQGAAKTAHDQIIYLSKIINDLSTLSRAERGVGDVVEDIDVSQLMHDLYARYEPEAAAKSLRLDIEVDPSLPHIETSRLYLEEIMQNFITNAIKYTKEGSVKIGAKLLSTGRIQCSVTDTGIGISKPDLEHVFEKFYRSEDYRTRETSGTGLGLYVVEKLAQKLETEIEVQSRLDHGSTFSFVLPLKSQRKKVDNTPVVQPSDTEDKKPAEDGAVS